jgi:hypothetical protein
VKFVVVCIFWNLTPTIPFGFLSSFFSFSDERQKNTFGQKGPQGPKTCSYIPTVLVKSMRPLEAPIARSPYVFLTFFLTKVHSIPFLFGFWPKEKRGKLAKPCTKVKGIAVAGM